MQGSIKRGKLAQIAECNIETIRYYENIGLLPVIGRTEGGHRLYSPEDQTRLRFILRTRELGFSIDELRGLLRLIDSNDYTCGEVLEMTTHHVKNVRKKIADLQRIEQTLADMSKRCEGGAVPDCPIIDTLFDNHMS